MSSLFISAGEASGDLHAAKLLEAFRRRGGEAGCWGMGGPRLRAAGCELLVDCAELGYIGFVDVVLHYNKILNKLNQLRQALRARRPQLVVLVDYPGLNMKLAHCARSLGIPVLYYVSPQIWAWRPQRIREIQQVVDMMMVLFPFEVEIYERAGVPVRFVGHPLVDEVHTGTDASALRAEFGLPPGRPTVGLLPGSRTGEVRRIMPILAESAQILEQRLGPVNFVVPVADTIDPRTVERLCRRARSPLRVVQGRTYDLIAASDAVATSSGTATLETALLRTPMTIVYKIGRINYWLMTRLIQVPYIGLVNIVAGRRVVQEYVQWAARPESIAEELQRLLQDRSYAHDMRAALADVAQRLGPGGASANAAEILAEMLAGSAHAPCGGRIAGSAR